MVVYETFPLTNHYAAKYTLSEYLQKWDIPLLTHIDTRAVVRKVRENGSAKAALVSGEAVLEQELPQKGIVEKEPVFLSADKKVLANKQHGSAVAYA